LWICVLLGRLMEVVGGVILIIIGLRILIKHLTA
jgi:putative Mn2+ efflux pump MntP